MKQEYHEATINIKIAQKDKILAQSVEKLIKMGYEEIHSVANEKMSNS